MTRYAANPGRAGHAMSVETSRAVFASRNRCAEFFGAEPENTVFTLNCTHALNQAIKGLFHPGAHYVLSDIEHNAVIRPVHALTERGGSYTLFRTSPDTAETASESKNGIIGISSWKAKRACRRASGNRCPRPRRPAAEGLSASCRAACSLQDNRACRPR